MTQLSNVLITDDNQNKLSVMKTSDNCVYYPLASIASDRKGVGY